MKLKKLTIEGFKSYKNKTIIDFQKMPMNHIFLIVGKTGAGKSTILDAITYALFQDFKVQKTTSFDFLNASIFDSHKNKNLQRNQILCQIELEFEYKQKTYSIKRIIKTKNFKNYKENLSEIIESEKEIYIYENHQQIPLQDLPFFMEFDHFRKMVVIPQNQFSDFIKMNTEEKSEFLSKIFGLDKIKNFIDFIEKEKKKIEEKKATIKTSLESILNRNQIKKSIEDPNVENEFQNNINEIVSEINVLQGEIKRDQENENSKQEKLKQKENLIIKWKEYKNIEQRKVKLESVKSEIEQKEMKINNAKKVLDLYPIYSRLKEIEKELKDKENNLENNQNKLKELNKNYLENQKEKTKLEKEKDEIEKDKTELNEKKDIKSKINIYEKIKNEIENLNKEIEKLNEEKQNLEKDKEKLEKELEQIEKNLFDIYRAFLSSSLKKGNPCPVCGSTEHPSPYKGEHLPLGSEELLKNRQEFQKKIKEIDFKIKEKEQKIRKKEEEKNKKEKEIQSIEDFIKKYYKDIEINEIKRKLDSDIKELDEKIKNFEEKSKQINTEEVNLNNQIGKLEGIITELNNSIKELQQEKKTKTEELDQKLQDRNLQINNIQEFYIEQKEIEKIEKEITEFNNKLIELDSIYKGIQKEIESLYSNFFGLPDQEMKIQEIQEEVNNLKKEIQELENNIQQKNQMLGSLQEKINNLRNDLNDFIQSFNQFEIIYKEFQIIEKLHQILDGKNSKNLSFDRYLLHVYFDIIVQNANSRLKSINGRYHLVTTIEKEKQKQQKYGLGLKIFDHYHGVERPIYDLSGGETFYVSLALALGLNDMFHQRSPNAQFDFLFIDEGFGSLDQETLDSVINTLEEYFINKRGNKQVGLISHVESMKERFSNQIIVENDKGISKISYKN